MHMHSTMILRMFTVYLDLLDNYTDERYNIRNNTLIKYMFADHKLPPFPQDTTTFWNHKAFYENLTINFKQLLIIFDYDTHKELLYDGKYTTCRNHDEITRCVYRCNRLYCIQPIIDNGSSISSMMESAKVSL